MFSVNRTNYSVMGKNVTLFVLLRNSAKNSKNRVPCLSKYDHSKQSKKISAVFCKKKKTAIRCMYMMYMTPESKKNSKFITFLGK